MKLKRILLPLDFSELSRAAAPLAKSLARDSGARLSVLYVEERPIELMAESGVPVSSLAPDTLAMKNELQRAVPCELDVACDYQVVVGSPAAEIVRFAAEIKADLIVMSTHGRRGLSHLLMGSVAEAVVRRAPCPVLTMKSPAPSPA